MPAGCPPKFKTAADLQAAIDEYEETLYEERVNSEGKLLKVKTIPFSVAGLCNHLCITRQCLSEWEHNVGKHPEGEEISDIVKKAKNKVELDITNGGLTGKYSAAMAIFLLKANHGLSDNKQAPINVMMSGNPDAPIRIEQVAVSPIKPMLINPDNQADALDPLEDD